MEVDPIEEIIEEEEQPTNNTPLKEGGVVFDSLYTLVETVTQLPMFYFDVPVVESGTARVDISKELSESKYYSLFEIMSDDRFLQFLPRQFTDRYEKILTLSNIDTLEKDMTSLLSDMDSYFTENDIFTYTTTDETLQKKQSINYNSKKTASGNRITSSILKGQEVETALPFSEVINLFEGVVSETISDADKVQAEIDAQTTEQERLSESVTTVIDNDGTVRTSSPAWGFKTDNNGKIKNSKGEKVNAPFFKNDEWNDFSDFSEADIFRLQKQMVQAGMQPPPVNEYGQWTKREANFMSVVFQKATDSGQWEIDQTNGLSGYETTLIDLGETYQETVDFINVLNTSNYGMPSPSPTTAQIKTLLDTAAAANGVVLSAKDYTDFANVVIKALSEEANSQRAFENAQVTDRDLILGTSFKDARTIGQGEVARFLSGTDLPLVLPSYEFLTKSKGPVPEIKSSATILEDEIARLKAPQIAGNIDLRNIAYTTNLFETAMGQLTYGGAESTEA